MHVFRSDTCLHKLKHSLCFDKEHEVLGIIKLPEVSFYILQVKIHNGRFMPQIDVGYSFFNLTSLALILLQSQCTIYNTYAVCT